MFQCYTIKSIVCTVPSRRPPSVPRVAGDPGGTLAAGRAPSSPDLPPLAAASRRRRAKPAQRRQRRGTWFFLSRCSGVAGLPPWERVVAVASLRWGCTACGDGTGAHVRCADAGVGIWLSWRDGGWQIRSRAVAAIRGARCGMPCGRPP